jgi:hypothetical protein
MQKTHRLIKMTTGVAIVVLVSLGVMPSTANAVPAAVASMSFNDAAGQVELTIPTPPCRPEGCTWYLAVSKVNGPGQPQTFVEQKTGTNDTVVVSYPENYCGVIQADYGVINSQTGADHKEVGHKHTVNTCTPPPTTTTTTSTTTSPPTTITVPPAPPATVPPVVPPGKQPEPVPTTVPTPVTGPPAAGTPVPVTPEPVPTTVPIRPAVGPHLAYTGGPPYALMVLYGLLAILGGLWLQKRRRAL